MKIKNNFNKILAVIMSVAIFFSVLGTSNVLAKDTAKARASGAGWSLKDGTLNITSNAGMSNWKKKLVDYKREVMQVNIGENVSSVAAFAFYDCSKLKAATFKGAEAPMLSNNAFGYCNMLEKIVIPSDSYGYSHLTGSDDEGISEEWLALSDKIRIDISDYSIELDDDLLIYDGTKKEPEVLFVESDSDESWLWDEYYDVAYSNNINAGDATVMVIAKGNIYTGVATESFEIEKATPTIFDAKAKDKVYDDTEYAEVSTVELIGANNKKLTLGVDFKATAEFVSPNVNYYSQEALVSVTMINDAQKNYEDPEDYMSYSAVITPAVLEKIYVSVIADETVPGIVGRDDILQVEMPFMDSEYEYKWSTDNRAGLSNTDNEDTYMISKTDRGKIKCTVYAYGNVVGYEVISNKITVGRPTPKAEKITISPPKAIVNPGQTMQFTAIVDGKGEFIKDIEWKITGSGLKAGTKIDKKTGLLTIANDEKIKRSIRVTAINAQGGIVKSVTAYVEAPSTAKRKK